MRPALERLAAQLKSWRGAQLFFSERMTLRSKHADSERTFSLTREHWNQEVE